jgi:hypothetical protein
MLSQNQVNDIFQTQLGRDATPEEYSKVSGASLNTLSNLKSMGYSENPPAPTNVTYDPTNPYTDPNVSTAAQNVTNIGNQISSGNDILQQVPDIIQKDIAQTGGIVTNPQFGTEVRQAEAPIATQLKGLGQQYNAARSTYSATLSAAKQAISQAKSQVSREQSRALTQAGKIITLLQNGELDPKKVDLSQIEANAGLPTGFFANITAKAPKVTEPKDNIRSVQGGLYNVTKGKWVIPAKTSTKKTTGTGVDKTTTSGGIQITQKDIGAGATQLNSSRGTDGYADTATYNKMMNYWVSKGGLIQDFIKYYPPKDYLNPNDKTVPSILKKYLSKSSSGTMYIPFNNTASTTQ